MYFILPILLFIVGWCRSYIAIIGTIVICASTFFLCKNAPKLWVPKTKKEMAVVFISLLLAFIWVYSSGIGALVFQNSDHTCRNPLFEYLVKYNWPVVLNIQADDYSNSFVLTYYIAFWLPSAMVGKIFNSIQLGYYSQVVWATLGVFLCFYYILSFLRKKTILPIIIFIFFSGMDILGAFIVGSSEFKNPISHLEWWFYGEQFSSFTTQLYWVFNQALPAWLMTLVILKEKNNKNLLFLYSLLFIHSTLPAIGIFPIVLYLAYKNNCYFSKKLPISLKKLKKSFLSIWTFQNILAGGLILIISLLYLTNNISGGSTGLDSYNFDIARIFLILFVFVSFEVGIYWLIIKENFKKDILFYLILFIFLFYPFYKVGIGSDFCMRATIPALVILYLYIVKYFDHGIKNKVKFYTLIILLIIGAQTPIHEMYRTIHYTKLGITKAKSDLSVSNFFAYYENNNFLKYVGKVNNEK